MVQRGGSEAKMGTNPIVIRIPGATEEKVATVNLRKYDSGMQKRTPEWMVSFNPLAPGLLTAKGQAAFSAASGVIGIAPISLFPGVIKATSTVNELNVFTELFGWHSEAHKFSCGNLANSLMAAAGVAHSPLVLIIPSGVFAADAEKAVADGTIINTTTIARLGYINGSIRVLQTVLFNGCRFTRFQQQLDMLILHCTVLKKTTIIPVFNKAGVPRGFGVGNLDLQHSTRFEISGQA
jgi:hypothetical protein